MELAHHGVVGFFPADGGGVKLLFLLLSVALVLGSVAGLSSIMVAGVVRFVFLLFCERAGLLFLCGFVFGAFRRGPHGFFDSGDGDGMRIYFRSLVSVLAAADCFSSSFLRELMADFRSSMRSGDASGRWLMRLIQGLESLSEKEGGACLGLAVLARWRQPGPSRSLMFSLTAADCISGRQLVASHCRRVLPVFTDCGDGRCAWEAIYSASSPSNKSSAASTWWTSSLVQTTAIALTRQTIASRIEEGDVKTLEAGVAVVIFSF